MKRFKSLRKKLKDSRKKKPQLHLFLFMAPLSPVISDLKGENRHVFLLKETIQRASGVEIQLLCVLSVLITF